MLFPLDFVYARSGVELPRVKAIDPDDIPLPYRSLLVHRTDMTLTLERHFGGRVALRPLATFRARPVVFPASPARAGVHGPPGRDGRHPHQGSRLSRAHSEADPARTTFRSDALLRDGGVDYESRPTVFLSVTPNPEMMGVFWMREPKTLYGRRTEMIHNGAKIGDIVEVLPLV